MQIIDADGHINDHACGEEIAAYMPKGNQMAKLFPEFDHLHFRYLKQNKLSPEPVFPGSTDESLLPHFLLNIPDEQAREILPALTKIAGVESAWIKPADELPA